MSSNSGVIRLTLTDFRSRISGEMVPLSSQFSYFVAGLPLQEEDIRDYLEDPISALPPRLVKIFPKLQFLLVPYLERSGNGKDKNHAPASDLIVFEKPPSGKQLRSIVCIEENSVVLAFGVQDVEAAEHHYELYHQLAWLTTELLTPEDLAAFDALLREELTQAVHGEVDESSWQAKQAVRRRPSLAKSNTREFREYCKLSFMDTLTLYLHGICCDIDVEPGPRQLPSRYLKRRLLALKDLFEPPKGYAVFPEDQDQAENQRQPG
jgi:hypothetical protein